MSTVGDWNDAARNSTPSSRPSTRVRSRSTNCSSSSSARRRSSRRSRRASTPPRRRSTSWRRDCRRVARGRMTERFYFRQLLAGWTSRSATPWPKQMVNFAYAFGDRETGEAVLVDPAYRPAELVELVEADGMRVTWRLRHALSRRSRRWRPRRPRPIAGIVELLETIDVPIHVQADEAEWVTKRTGVGAGALVAHDAGDVVAVGDIDGHPDPHAGAHAGQPMSVGRGPTHQWRHLVPRRLRAHRPAGLGPRGDVPHVDANVSRTSRTTRCSFPGTFTRPIRARRWARSAGTIARSSPASAEQWLAMFAR